jgi:voltage-gated potassium channel Kch
LAACAAGTVVFGTIGSLELQRGESGVASFSNALYQAFQLFALHTPHFDRPVPWTLDVGRWLGAASTVLAVMEFAGHALREELTLLRLSRLQGHVIVCGLGRKGLATVRCLVNAGKRVVVIEKASTPDMVEACRALGAHVLTGDATNPDILKTARVNYAQSLIALCPEDSTNCDIAALACRLRVDSPHVASPLQCRIQVSDAEARKTLDELLTRGEAQGKTVVRFFDSFDPEARQLLVHDLPLDHDGIKAGDKRQVHLIILGFGRMGRTLAIRAAQLGVFAQAGRLKISVIDRKAELHEKELSFHHTHFGEVCDIEFHQFEAISPETLKLLKDWCARRDAVTSVAVCFDNEQRALEIALQLEPLIASNDVRVAVRFSCQSGLARLIKETGTGVKGQLRFRPLGMDERTGGRCGLGHDPAEQFARQIHGAYVKMRRSEAGQDAEKLEKLAKDAALKDWDDLTEDFRESNRQQADHIFIKLRALDMEVADAGDKRAAVTEFTPDQVEILSELEHRRWLAERRIANWTLAPLKDEIRRENPNLVAWEKITEDIKDYDRETVRLIPSLLAGAGRTIVRRSEI